MKTKTLSALRIEEKTESLMNRALIIINKDSLLEISMQNFRRLCYDFTSQKIIMGEKIKLQVQ